MGNPLPSRVQAPSTTEGSTSIRLCGLYKAVRCTLAPYKYSERRGTRVQYHEVKLNFTFSTTQFMADAGVNHASDSDMFVSLWVDYVYLDTDERRRFAQVSHEYLITQVQFTGDETSGFTNNQSTQNLRLNLNHPCKYLAWVFANPNAHGHFAGNTETRDGTTDTLAPLDSAKLQLNGHDRFAVRPGMYFNYTQPYQTMQAKPRAGVYMYSFALSPDQHQPSGSCNFSRFSKRVTVPCQSTAASGFHKSCKTTRCGNTVTQAYLPRDSWKQSPGSEINRGMVTMIWHTAAIRRQRSTPCHQGMVVLQRLHSLSGRTPLRYSPTLCESSGTIRSITPPWCWATGPRWQTQATPTSSPASVPSQPGLALAKPSTTRPPMSRPCRPCVSSLRTTTFCA